VQEAHLGAAFAVVVGSFAYNVTMTLGAGALVRPLTIADADTLHMPWFAAVADRGIICGLAAPNGRLAGPATAVLLAIYALFVRFGRGTAGPTVPGAKRDHHLDDGTVLQSFDRGDKEAGA
jgi:Ca2+/Na+ antiporter